MDNIEITRTYSQWTVTPLPKIIMDGQPSKVYCVQNIVMAKEVESIIEWTVNNITSPGHIIRNPLQFEYVNKETDKIVVHYEMVHLTILLYELGMNKFMIRFN